jgi:hypothetical protein
MADTQKNALDTLSHFVRTNLSWILGLVPFGLAAFQVLWISVGDPHVFGYIMQDLNVVTVVLTVSLPLIRVEAVGGQHDWAHLHPLETSR